MAAELLSGSPSPSRDQGVFGKELRLSESERQQLSSAGEIFLTKIVHVESRSKKGDGTEPRKLVISSSRCYLFIQSPTTKLETSFNFLRIQQLQCTSDKLIFHLTGEAKPRELLASRQDSIEVVSLITAQLKNVFPKTPLNILLKMTFDPDSLRDEVSSLRDELTARMDRVDASTIQGFLTAYAFLCDFFGVEYSREVSWYLKTVYLAHGLREIKFSDFEYLSPKEFLPVVSSLRHNFFFEGIVERDSKIGTEVVEELSSVLSTSHSIKSLVLSNCGLKPESIVKVCAAIKNNPRSSLLHLNLTDNVLDDKAADSLSSALEGLPHGLQKLTLASCKMTVRGASALANSMKLNKHMQFSLVHLDLSSNILGPESLGALAFIQETQTISTLKLSNCGLLLETVVPLLIRGCTQHLCELDLSSNAGKGKKVVHGPSVASGLQQFCSSSIAIRSLNLSNCKLTSTPVMKVLEGFAVNPNVTAVKLDVSSNDLSGSGAHKMLSVIGRVSCLQQLNLSDCALDHSMPDVIAAVTENKNLRHLLLGRNFSGKNPARVMAVQSLVTLLARDDCHLVSLCLEDSQLKEHTNLVLDALVENASLAKINLSGNQMGSRGARCLAKALLSNCSLTEISWDRNDTQLHGFQEISMALQQNYTLRVMPLPLGDIGRARKGVEECVQRIQRCLCRNHSDERLKVEIAARHRSRLLTASQQSSAVGRELVQLEDLLEYVQTQFPSHDLIREGAEVKELANHAIKLTDGLYSPKVESEQFRRITEQVRDLLNNFMEGLFGEHIMARSEKMVEKAVEICNTHLSEDTRMKLQDLVVCEKGEEFAQAKKDVLRHALPEIVNHVSDSNVDVAANISELIVEHTLQSLEKINHKLLKLQKETQALNQQTTDAKVSRNFTFRVQEDSSPSKKKKKRVRRPDWDEDDEDTAFVDLPIIPLTTDGPTLQHLGKSRPKPARLQKARPSKRITSPLPDSAPHAPDSTSQAPDSAPQAPDPAPQAPDSTSQAPDPAPPALNSTPPAAEHTTPQLKVAMKPPSPQVAQKKIQELLQMKSRSFIEVLPPDEKVAPQEEEEEEEEEASSDERGTSEEVEEHRTVQQQDNSSDEVDNNVVTEPTKSASSEQPTDVPQGKENTDTVQEGTSDGSDTNSEATPTSTGEPATPTSPGVEAAPPTSPAAPPTSSPVEPAIPTSPTVEPPTPTREPQLPTPPTSPATPTSPAPPTSPAVKQVPPTSPKVKTAPPTSPGVKTAPPTSETVPPISPGVKTAPPTSAGVKTATPISPGLKTAPPTTPGAKTAPPTSETVPLTTPEVKQAPPTSPAVKPAPPISPVPSLKPAPPTSPGVKPAPPTSPAVKPTSPTFLAPSLKPAQPISLVPSLKPAPPTSPGVKSAPPISPGVKPAPPTSPSPKPAPPSSPAAPPTSTKPVQEQVKVEAANSKKSFFKSRGSLKSSGNKEVGASKSDSVLLSEWEVIDGEAGSKKPPPAVKVKPKPAKPTAADSAKKDGDGKKSPILPSPKITLLANVLKNAPVKNENGDVKESPTKPQQGPTKSSPSPVPKPRPKPASRKKIEENTDKPATASNV